MSAAGWGLNSDDAAAHAFPALHEYRPHGDPDNDLLMPRTAEITIAYDPDNPAAFREQAEAERIALEDRLRAEGAWSLGIQRSNLRLVVTWFVRHHVEEETFYGIAYDARASDPEAMKYLPFVHRKVHQVGALLRFPKYVR
jgi:hypothetical protein